MDFSDHEKNKKPHLLLLGCIDLKKSLQGHGLDISVVRSIRNILEPKEDLDPRAIVIGPELFKEFQAKDAITLIRERWPMVDVIIWFPKASSSLVRNALNSGAKDVIMTASAENCSREIAKIVRAQQLLPRAVLLGSDNDFKSEFGGLHSRSRKMFDLFNLANQVAPTEANILILGETGTGKELLARAIHRYSKRSGRFVPINCGAVSESLVDSELFGHVKGAFTGATQDKAGLFKYAQDGSLFLDEIGNVPSATQQHLLRALQEGAIRPVGGHQEIPVNARVIAATSADLENDVQQGRFREDLFYRLDVIRIEIPPLRERPEDIVFLFAHFAKKIAADYNVKRPDLREDFIDALTSYDWPGNVRQLENFTERLILTQTGRRVNALAFKKLLPFKNPVQKAAHKNSSQVLPISDPEFDVGKTLEESIKPHIAVFEKKYFEACLKHTRGRVGEAAFQAGVSRRTLLRKLKLYKLDKNDFRPKRIYK